MPVHQLFGGYGDYEEALLLMHLNANVVPVCTHCSGELRIEYYGQIADEGYKQLGYMHGFCSKCMKHCALCGKSPNLARLPCIRSKDHEGDHKNERNVTWK